MGREGCGALWPGNGHDSDVGRHEEAQHLRFRSGHVLAQFAREGRRGLENGERGRDRRIRSVEAAQQKFRSRLLSKNRDHRGRIDEHHSSFRLS
jgi:hypothetical protein